MSEAASTSDQTSQKNTTAVTSNQYLNSWAEMFRGRNIQAELDAMPELKRLSTLAGLIVLAKIHQKDFSDFVPLGAIETLINKERMFSLY